MKIYAAIDNIRPLHYCYYKATDNTQLSHQTYSVNYPVSVLTVPVIVIDHILNMTSRSALTDKPCCNVN